MTTLPRVLLVEDNADNRRLMQRIIGDLATLLEASDGAEGLRLAQAERPDLILMDLSLPVMSGWDVTLRLKADPATRHIPIVVVSAHAMEGDREKAIAAGCDAYVAKPIEIAPFLALLERLLAPVGSP